MKKLIGLLIVISMLFASCGKNNSNETKSSTEGDKIEQNVLGDKKIKMILDLDTGVDDAMALAYALGHPNIELIGVTTVFGNVSRDTSIKNTLDLLALLGHKDVPVFAGNDRPTGAKSVYLADEIVKNIHGPNGIGDVVIPKSDKVLQEQNAVDFIIESANKYGKDLYLVATGPETNLGELIKKDPKIGEKLGKTVVMGGALIVQGNMNHYAEANIHNDPVAANEFFTSNTPFTMVGLDVTLRPNLTKADTQKWRELGTESGKAFADIVDFYIDFYLTTNLPGCALHDPLAVAVAMHPEYVKTLTLPMKVGTSKDDWGRTIADHHKINDQSFVATTEVAIDLKVNEFVNDFNKILTDLFAKN